MFGNGTIRIAWILNPAYNPPCFTNGSLFPSPHCGLVERTPMVELTLAALPMLLGAGAKLKVVAASGFASPDQLLNGSDLVGLLARGAADVSIPLLGISAWRFKHIRFSPVLHRARRAILYWYTASIGKMGWEVCLPLAGSPSPDWRCSTWTRSCPAFAWPNSWPSS